MAAGRWVAPAVVPAIGDMMENLVSRMNLRLYAIEPGVSATTGVAEAEAAGLRGVGGAGAKGVSGAVRQADLDVLAANGVKFTPENVIATGKTPSGQIVFLETGNSSAGLQHIVEGHASDFASIGVSSDKISSVVMQAVTEGKIVGYQGAGIGRPIYEITINGQPQRIAVTVGNNGFIVGANPAGGIK